MIDPSDVPEVADNEQLARYVLFSGHKRKDDTLKPDAFIPHPYQELSVTRHRDASIDEIWAEGDRVAGLRKTPLYGFADILARLCRDQGLTVEPVPILPENPNHADIGNWPSEKPLQKAIAQVLAKAAGVLKTRDS